MAGAAIGALASFLVINGAGAGSEGLASDEVVFGTFVAGGAGLGALTQKLLESRLEPLPASAGIGSADGRPVILVRLEL